jgi:hypothetical protein
MAPCSRRWFHQLTHSRVASSTCSALRHGPRRPISSALYSPLTASARALMPLCQAAVEDGAVVDVSASTISGKSSRAM